MTARSWKRFMSLQNKEAFQIADLSEAGNKTGTWPMRYRVCAAVHRIKQERGVRNG